MKEQDEMSLRFTSERGLGRQDLVVNLRISTLDGGRDTAATSMLRQLQRLGMG
jgi:hypothetical protein